MNFLQRLKQAGLELKSGIPTTAENNKNHGKAKVVGFQLRSDNITAELPMKKAKAMRKPKWLIQLVKDRAQKEYDQKKLDSTFEAFKKYGRRKPLPKEPNAETSQDQKSDDVHASDIGDKHQD